MSSQNPFTLFPNKHLKPYEGMSVTAEIWEQAHSYHDRRQQAHDLFFHGTGILTGLEVIASDPPDNLVYILPGVAVDSLGRVIVLPEPVAYDVGSDIEGPLFLLLSYREGQPTVTETPTGLEIQYVDERFMVQATPTFPNSPVIELARLVRSNRAAAIVDALEPTLLKVNELDLRYRPVLRMNTDQLVSTAVVYLGGQAAPVQGRGLAGLAPELRQSAQINLVVDDNSQLMAEVGGYTLLYLVAEGAVQVSPAIAAGLHQFIAKGGTLFLEAVDEPGMASLTDLCAQLNVTPQPVGRGHALLAQPYLFFAPPAGYEENGQVLADEGVILSTAGYGRLWAGEAKDHPLARTEARVQVEWAANLLVWALERRHALASA